VKSNHQFIIPFKGLKVGRHDFSFEINDKFFDDFIDSEIKKGKVSVDVCLDKKTTMLELDFNIKGEVWVICDRCLDDFLLPIEYESKLYVKFGEATEEQTDEILILSHNEYEIDIAQFIYEFIHLSLPYKKLHPTDNKGKSLCNKEMLNKLNEYIIHKNEINDIDPRWDDLKNLYLNNN
jgi:uncharacterized metal-binding protein YceD (DUF177 family)